MKFEGLDIIANHSMSTMKSGGIDLIANHLAEMKLLGTRRNSPIAATATSPASSTSTEAAGSTYRTTQNRTPLRALALDGGNLHGKDLENTHIRRSGLTPPNDNALAFKSIAADVPEESAGQARKRKLKPCALNTNQKSVKEKVVHAATLGPAPSPPLPPSSVTFCPNSLSGMLKTSSPETPARNDNGGPGAVTIKSNNLLYITPDKKTDGSGRRCPPPRPSTCRRLFKTKTDGSGRRGLPPKLPSLHDHLIRHLSPLKKKVRIDT